MLNSRWRIICWLLVAYIFSAASLAQNGPFSTNAIVSLLVGSTAQQVGQEFSVDLVINLNGATGLNGSGTSTPAILGAFLFNVGFVPADLQFTGADNGTAAEFTSTPVYTDPTIANSAGFVGVINTQAGTSPHSGAYLVGRVRFRPLRTFGSSLLTIAPSAAANPLSLSSAFLSGPPSAGPALINFTAGPSLSISAAQPSTSTTTTSTTTTTSSTTTTTSTTTTSTSTTTTTTSSTITSTTSTTTSTTTTTSSTTTTTSLRKIFMPVIFKNPPP